MKLNSIAFKKLLSIMLLFAMVSFVACEGSGEGDSSAGANWTQSGDSGNNGNGSGNGSGSAVAMRSMKLYDANDVFLGYCTSVYYGSISLISSKDYMYSLNWDGQVTKWYFYFTEENCQGIMFIQSHNVVYGKAVFRYKNRLYTFETLDVNGNAIPDGEITHYKSLYNFGEEETYPSNTFPLGISISENYKAYPLTEISKDDAGIPENIALPLSIKHEAE